MRALRFALLTLVRDWKSGELTVLMLALVVAVAALTAVGFFTNRVSRRSRTGRRSAGGGPATAVEPALAARIPRGSAARGLRTARTLSTLSVVFNGERAQLDVAARGRRPAIRCAARCALRIEPFGAGAR